VNPTDSTNAVRTADGSVVEYLDYGAALGFGCGWEDFTEFGIQ